ncbi:hypothetical protein GCM10023338_21860 [Wohlfahrtiimonas larvae]|uniref:Prepilin-type N-terminal cleavage/methylation domain-containing protein n=2 Tax=Wohlfahrtiimonas larvae TaxID=1157986 RepID=A0ABP9MWM7_9GAMM
MKKYIVKYLLINVNFLIIKVVMGERMTLIEVMVALAIIVGVVMVAYQYHEMMIMSNRELLLQQENLLTDENQFDQNYVMEF